MTRAIVLDTETTGIDNPDVIQLAYSEPAESPHAVDTAHCVMFRPTKPIALGALATHHILAEELQHLEPWPGRWELPAGTEYIVGHKVDFDWEAIGKPDVKRICTLALARYVWPDLDSHSLGALTYYIHDHREAKSLLQSAHSASTDILLCHHVLLRLIDAAGAKTWPDLWALSEKARVPVRFWFGKHGPQGEKPGRLISEIRREDPSYIHWCLTKCDQVTSDPYAQKAMRGESA
jgi:exodeoxyribonuclease X